VLLNTWKHHAGVIRAQISLTVGAGERGLGELSQRLAAIGADLMDLYLGALSPLEIGNQIIVTLRVSNCLALETYAS
jgi:hypothetical protein